MGADELEVVCGQLVVRSPVFHLVAWIQCAGRSLHCYLGPCQKWRLHNLSKHRIVNREMCNCYPKAGIA